MPVGKTRKYRKSVGSFTKKCKSLSQKKPYVPSAAKSINPGTDFYSYVNANWQRRVKMPPFLSSYGVSEEIEELVNAELLDILMKARKEIQSKANTKLEQSTILLGTLTESIMNTYVQDENIKFLQKFLTSLNCVRTIQEVGVIMGQFIKSRIDTLLMFSVVPLEEKGTSLKLAIFPGRLSLPDPSYYLVDSPFNSRVLKNYASILKVLESDFNLEQLDSIISLEQMAAEPLEVAKHDAEQLMKGYDIQTTYKYIPLEAICNGALGWSKSKTMEHSFLVISPRWLTNLNKWFRTIPLDSWKKWLMVNCLMYVLPLLPPPYDDLHFELFGHRMRGQSMKMPQYRLALQMAKEWLAEPLGNMFIQNCVSEELKNTALELAGEIQTVAAERAGSTPWLDKNTQNKARKKVQKIFLGIAYPTKTKKDYPIKLHPERFLENIFSLGAYDFEEDMKKANTQLNPTEWDDPVFSVNAYYYNSGNRLILPSGILRWPFFSPTASDGWNFGGLGASIGHEICHAFDNDGKEYDEFGNWNPWWSRKEVAQYTKKAKALVDLYSRTKYFGKSLNGYLTLSENIADLGGVDIALSALKKRLEKRGVSKEVYKKELCDFFISFAVSWRTKEKRQKAMQSLFMDVHAPPLARVNNIVCQFDEWYECFDIKPGSVLYKAPQERIRIF